MNVEKPKRWMTLENLKNWMEPVNPKNGISRDKMQILFAHQFRAGFMPRTIISMITLAISFGVAIGLYNIIQKNNQEKLFQAWLSADPIPEYCNGFSHLSADVCSGPDLTNEGLPSVEGEFSNRKPDLSQLLYEIFLSSELIDRQTYPTAVDFAGALPNELHAIRGIVDRRLADYRTQNGTRKGLEFIAGLNNSRCWASDFSSKTLANAASVAAYILSDGPGGSDSLLEGGRSCLAAKAAANALDFKSPTKHWQTWRLSASTCLGSRDAMRALMQQANVISKISTDTAGYNLGSGENDCRIAQDLVDAEGVQLNETEFIAAQYHVTKIMETLLAEMAAIPAIKDATTTLRMWRGLEHIGIMALSIFVLFVLCLRIFTLWRISKRNRHAQQADSNAHEFAVAFRREGVEGA